ncbi:DUF5011 domain-containing protein [Thalassotalea psychrophila]|uniref:DUF5011 domain-containing protein n=1 Tax=Thalassotalea psychrophila TaxID=3065647 RepID=A0ABY9TUH2_9GAMM|nr:DUF5011 domain-containing protein [Colwelliaceae bacterium SQ149]
MIFKPAQHSTAIRTALSLLLLTLTACGGSSSGSKDTQAPTISLVGDNPMTVAHGVTFTDPGSSISDNVDTGLSASVSGSVDTNALGSYSLNYSVTDKAGNSATVERIVNVTDQTVPLLTLIGEQTIMVEQNSSFTDPGSNTSDNIDSELVVTVTGEVDLTKVGSYTLSYNVTDSAGNTAVTVTRTVEVTAITGQLVGSIISGLPYQTETQSGLTNAEGQYKYLTNESISFALGDTPIGDTVGVQKELSLTDIISDAVLYTTYGQLHNLDKLPDYHSDKEAFFRFNNTLSLLESIDDDSNPDNGINIPAGVVTLFNGKTINLKQHMFYLAGKGRRYGDGDKTLKHVLQPAAAQGFIDSGNIVDYGIALDNYYRLNGIAHQFEVMVKSSTDNGEDGSIDATEVFTYDSLGNVTSYVEDDNNDGNPSYIRLVTFNENGRELSYTYDEDGDGIANQISYRHYDLNGNQIKYERDQGADGNFDGISYDEFDNYGNEISYSYDNNGDGTINESGSSTFDANGNRLTNSYDVDNDGLAEQNSEYTYDERGNRLSSISYNSDKSVRTGLSQYSYDERDNRISANYDWDGDGNFEQTETTSYDINNNRLIEQRDDDNDGNIDWISIYSYDDLGNQVFSSYDEVGVNKDSYYYTFDSFGNRLTYQGDDNSDGTINDIFTHIYDSDGYMLSQEYDWGNDGSLTYAYYYTHNSAGNMLSRREDTDGDGNIDKLVTYTLAPATFRAVFYNIF